MNYTSGKQYCNGTYLTKVDLRERGSSRESHNWRSRARASLKGTLVSLACRPYRCPSPNARPWMGLDGPAEPAAIIRDHCLSESCLHRVTDITTTRTDPRSTSATAMRDGQPA